MPERRSPWLPIAALISLLVGCGDSENPPPGPTDAGPRVVESGELCGNATDDDGDSLVDCDDDGCAAEAACIPPETGDELCGNGADDDGDGLVDCDDDGCADAIACSVPPPEQGEAACSNRADDDRDGLIDCMDGSCASARACAPPPPEMGEAACGNGVDDDRDGATDCADSGCRSTAVCTPPENTETLCGNGGDDDRDGLVDCDDPGCLPTMACRPIPETSLVLCSNGLDDDRDGWIDCLDEECSSVPSCVGGPVCGEVPLTGRCSTPTRVEYCAVSSGDGAVDRLTYDCLSGESCVVTSAGASCVLTATCRDGDIRCVDSTHAQVCSGGAWSTVACPRSCVGTALGDGCSPDASTRTTSGVVRYDARGPNAGYTDWGALSTIPAQGFIVATVRFDAAGDASFFDAVITSGGDAATGGRFSLNGPSVATANDYIFVFAAGVDASARFTYAVANPGYAASATPRNAFDPMPDPSFWAWSWPLMGRVDGAELRITEAMGSGAARVFDYLRYTHGATADYFSPSTPRTVVAWVGLGTTWDCGACVAASQTVLSGVRFQQQAWIAGGASAGYWSDAVTAHEFGHVTMNAYGLSPGEGGSHTLGIPVQPGMAWSEGWATFFSSDVRDDPRYYDKQGGFFWFDIRSRTYSSGPVWTRPDPTGGLLQPIDENEVAAMLWTLSAYVPRESFWEALRSPRVIEGPFERMYTRRIWTDPMRPYLFTDTMVNVPCLPDYLDALECLGLGAVDPTTMDLATQPSTRYPYPSRSPLCR